ncbi:hypothetical protein PsorP6_013764 [Peronosclerospora sorghi]|uniref:Uncharacterized protein n=1 Tax=Peronosclerospora sorghi TaxID=230839 RepID=A0ACC0VH12_9STRA|nr:hypothetical protein PsorP6_013764 [Peronosclerospora sorghi]
MDKLAFTQCRGDPCFFIRRRDDDEDVVHVVLYVDDLLVGSKTQAAADDFCDELLENFVQKTLGYVRYSLGMEIASGKTSSSWA